MTPFKKLLTGLYEYGFTDQQIIAILDLTSEYKAAELELLVQAISTKESV